MRLSFRRIPAVTCGCQKELSKTMPLDKIYPQNEDTYKEEEISIDKKIPEEIENINDNPTCNNNNDDFGLYKKYL